MTPTAADVDAIDAEYRALMAEAAQKPPSNWEPDRLSRHRRAGLLAGEAAQRLHDAIRDHDIAAFGELLPEEEPSCPSSLPSP